MSSNVKQCHIKIMFQFTFFKMFLNNNLNIDFTAAVYRCKQKLQFLVFKPSVFMCCLSEDAVCV